MLLPDHVGEGPRTVTAVERGTGGHLAESRPLRGAVETDGGAWG